MRTFLPPDGFFTEARVPKLQHVPILIGHDGSYPTEVNRYLTERCLGEWLPPAQHGTYSTDPTVPTLKSRLNLASRLSAFFHWLSLKRDRDWRSLSYHDDVAGTYQADLLNGKGAASKRKLSDGTTNSYVDEAVLFLKWAAERGYRKEFRVPTRRVRVRSSGGTNSYGHLGWNGTTRHGRLAVQPANLTSLPTDDELAKWFRAARLRFPVKALLFEFLARTGARISEANSLRLTCFPRKVTWQEGWLRHGHIPITLRYGVKGPKISPASDRSARTRMIFVPIDLAERIERYVAFSRPHLLARYRRAHNDKNANTDMLWLGEQKGMPVSNDMLRRAWKKTPHCPNHWHPHAARHLFAVNKLIESTSDILNFHGHSNVGGVSFGWLHGLMAGQVRLILSPLLGHVTEQTTMRYLQYALQRMKCGSSHPSITWNRIINGEDAIDGSQCASS